MRQSTLNAMALNSLKNETINLFVILCQIYFQKLSFYVDFNNEKASILMNIQEWL